MFGSSLFFAYEAGGFADAFVGCSAGICRLGKKIGCRNFLLFWEKMGNFGGSYLFAKSTNPCLITYKRIIKDSSLLRKRQIAPKHQKQSGSNE
jgi:hypothetical protein